MAVHGQCVFLFHVGCGQRTTNVSTDNQAQMMSSFKAAMAKLAVLGQDVSQMVDCSDVVSNPINNKGSQILIFSSDPDSAAADEQRPLPGWPVQR